MSENDTEVRLQIKVARRIRSKLKSAAADQDVDMSELGAIVLDYALGLMANGKTPPALDQAIKQFKKKKAETGPDSD